MKKRILCNAPNQIYKTFKSYGLTLVFMVFGFNLTYTQNPNADENATVEGGVVSTTDNTSICLGDDNPDTVNAVVEGASGRVKQWLVTDDDGDDPKILALPESSLIDFGAPITPREDILEPGNYRIYHLSYNGIKPLGQPFWHKHVTNLSDILGRFDLSDNYIEILVQQKPTGGSLEGGPFEFCVGDGEPDHIPDGAITLSGNLGANSQWVVTNEDGSEILGLPSSSYTEVNFDDAPAGTCLVWHLMYEDGLSGLEVGANPADLMGCFEFSSNAVTVIRKHAEGGTLEGGPFEFCVGDGEADHIPEGAITLTGNEGISQWVVTNEDATEILGLPENSYTEVNFDEAPAGTCLVWHLSYEYEITGLEVGANPADLMGCFSLSNSITVIRKHTEGGTLTGGPFEFTVGDGTADNIPDGAITLEGNIGANSQWVVTNGDGTIILALPTTSYTEVNFDTAPAGTCLVWHLSYEEGLQGLAVDALVADLSGACFSLSNSITVTRNAASAGIVWIIPNPSGSVANLDFSDFKSDDVTVSIHNLINARVFNQSYDLRTLDSRRVSINVSGYDEGLYFVRVTDNSTGKDYIKRLIVN